MTYPPVTLTMLSCRRYELFEKTFLSFLAHCKDLDLIQSIILVDDNSSSEDLIKMKELLKKLPVPNLIIHKTDFKGQAASLNILSLLTHSKYSFHVEDDWSFVKDGGFIRSCIEVMYLNPSVKRVCVDASSSGKNLAALDEEIQELPTGAKYFVHTYQNPKEWPSFTFRQCLVDNSILKEIGMVRGKPTLSHDGSSPTAETDYAVRYCAKGYHTAFLMERFCAEISGGKASAFTLNDVNRHSE